MVAAEHADAVEVAPDLWQLALPIHRHSLGGANAFLIRDRDGYVLLDCGTDVAECSDALARQLAGLGVPFDALHTVVLTHGHADHRGQAGRVRELSRARVLMHENDAAFIGYPNSGGEDARQELVAWLRRYGFPEPEIVALVETFASDDRWTIALHADRLLAGGETFDVGRYRFEVLWTPDHTPGHICLYDPSHGVLLCGDHILEVVAPNVGLHPLLSDNPLPTYLGSLRDLAGRDIGLTLPGHGAPILDLGRTTTELLRRQLDRREQLLALLTPSPRSAYELAAQVWAQRGRRNWSALQGPLRRNAIGAVAAHLELLVEMGEVEQAEGETVGFFRRG